MFCFIPRIAAVFLVVVAGALGLAAAEERPLVASGEGSASNGGFQGVGQATHLGRSSLTGDLYTDFLAFGVFFANGGSLESANHDFLRFVFDEDAYDFNPATGVVSTTVTFTGGTGRFQNATGSADVMFDFDQYFYNFEFLIDGSIDY